MRIKNWTWADIPAVLLAAVRAATVTAGAILVRGGLPWQVFALLGIAIAGLALVIERQASERLNQPLNPQQSVGALLICWIPTLAIAVTLNALTAFSVVAPSVGKRETERAYQQYWRLEIDRIAAWTLNVRSTAARLVESKQREIDAEQARVVAARRERVSYSVAPLNALRRELTVSRDLLRGASALDALPLEAPVDHANGSQVLGNSLRTLTDVFVSAGGLLPNVPAPTAPATFESPIIDLPTVFINETIERHSSAMVAWVVALFLEVLSFVALWRGGRRVQRPISYQLAGAARHVHGVNRRDGREATMSTARASIGVGRPVVRGKELQGCTHRSAAVGAIAPSVWTVPRTGRRVRRALHDTMASQIGASIPLVARECTGCARRRGVA